MTRLSAPNALIVLLPAFVIGCCAVVAQSQNREQKLDPAVLIDAPVVPQMLVESASVYGYQTTICWVCWSSFGPREMADKTKPVTPPGALDNPEHVEPPPDAVPDISATSESNLIDAWNGTGPYARDGKQRRNYRVIAVIRTSTYMLAAASKKSGITNLRHQRSRGAYMDCGEQPRNRCVFSGV